MEPVSLLTLVALMTLASCDVISYDSRLRSDRLGSVEQQLRHQSDVIQQLTSQLSHLDTVNHDLIAKLLQQENRLSQQGQIIRKQSKKLLDLDESFKRLTETCLISPSPQTVNKPQSVYKPQSVDNPQLLDKPQLVDKLQSGDSQILSSLSRTSRTPHHDVIARSDDLGPLGAVLDAVSQHVTQLSADVQTLKNAETKHATDIQTLTSNQNQVIRDASSSSSTFVRWGSSACPGNSSLVYSGIAGGSYSGHSGAAVNYLCLTLTPVFSDLSSHGGSLLYGAEYQTDDNHHDKDTVCAVCRAAVSTVMIPGTNACTQGWTVLYSGYLMAGGHSREAGSEYVCVDAGLESQPGSGHNHDSALFHLTKTRCGSLPCGPYKEDKTVTCVVCGQ